MNRMMMTNAVALLGLVGACCFTGCAPVDSEGGEEQVGEAQQAEVDPGERVWRGLTMTLADPASTPFATVYLFNQSLGSYQAGTEYWFVNLDSVSLIGRYALNIAYTNETSTTAPPDPSYASEQSFSLPNLTAWGTGWSRDPGSGGSFYSGPSQQSLRLTTGTSGLANVMWYQVIPSTATAANITPSGLFNLGATSVSVPSGYLGYSISQSP